MLWSQIPLPPCDGEALAEFKILCFCASGISDDVITKSCDGWITGRQQRVPTIPPFDF